MYSDILSIYIDENVCVYVCVYCVVFCNILKGYRMETLFV